MRFYVIRATCMKSFVQLNFELCSLMHNQSKFILVSIDIELYTPYLRNGQYLASVHPIRDARG